MSDLYISVDVETDGPAPFKNSMIDLGAAAFTLDAGIIGTFSQALKPMEGCSPNPITLLEFWNKIPERYKVLQADGQDPKRVMLDFVAWVKSISNHKKPTFIAYPAGYDFTWTYTYLMYYVGYSPFGFVALDFKSYTAGLLKMRYRDVSKRTMPKTWFHSQRKHTHIAVEDAEEQAQLFIHALTHLG
jgi:hypothetical protein